MARTLKEYDHIMYSKIFSITMARDRFLSILRMLNFSNNEEQIEGDQPQDVHDIFGKFVAVF
jgi:hypothetical protein